MYLFTSESVSPGHPDKCADIISDSIVDYYLQRDPNAKVAAEVLIAGKNVTIGGEINSSIEVSHSDFENIVRDTLIKIGYTGHSGFTRKQTLYPDDVEVRVQLVQQSSEINSGVVKEDGELGAGDQGIMFGYASVGDDNFMPLAISYSRLICDKVYQYALDNPNELGVDIKTQVTVDYGFKDNFSYGLAKRLDTIIVSAPYTEQIGKDKAQEIILKLIEEVKQTTHLFDDETVIKINPSGSYIQHSSLYDSGLTGRKLIVDSFGGYAPIGGGAQSGKDYTKVDRSGLYATRWIAKHIVASDISATALVQISYAIGEAKPISITVDTQGTSKTEMRDDELSQWICESFPLTPKWIKEKFTLDKPSSETFLYADVASKGQVGVKGYPWETLDEIDKFLDLRASYKEFSYD